MNIWQSITRWASSAWHTITGIPSDIGSAASHIWSFITTVAQMLDWVLRNPFLALVTVVDALVGLLTGNMKEFHDANNRLNSWIFAQQTAPTRALVWRLYRQAIAQLRSSIALTIQWAKSQFAATRRYALALVARERRARIRSFRQAEAYARQHVRALHHQLEREAASGYAVSRQARLGLVARLLGDIAGRDPAVRAVTDRIAGLVLDLAGAESEPERLLASFLLSHLVRDLGVDKPIGGLAQALLAPLTGDPKPHDIHGVIADLAARLGALEAQQAQFMADGGPEILQAGEGWRDLTSLGVDAALLGFAAAATLDPAGTARDLAALTEAAGTDTITRIASVLGQG